MGEVRIAAPGAGKLQEYNRIAALFVVAWRPTGTLEDTALVTQCPDITPVKLREAEKSTTDQAKHKPTWYLHG